MARLRKPKVWPRTELQVPKGHLGQALLESIAKVKCLIEDKGGVPQPVGPHTDEALLYLHALRAQLDRQTLHYNRASKDKV